MSEISELPCTTPTMNDLKDSSSDMKCSSTSSSSSQNIETTMECTIIPSTIDDQKRADSTLNKTTVLQVVLYSCLLVLASIYCIIPTFYHQLDEDIFPISSTTVRRKLRQHGKIQPPFDINKMGTNSFIFNRSVFGAIIMSDYARMHGPDTRVHGQDIVKPFFKDPMVILDVPINATHAEVATIRSHNARAMVAQLPFPVIHWPPVITQPCPHGSSKTKAERGHLWAHLQIWMDFVFFDHDVLLAVQDKRVKGEYYGTSWSSKNGIYMASENGTLYKNNLLFYEEDILVIFEDDADIASGEVNATLRTILHTELSNMSTDLLYLGQCEEKSAHRLCSHAYAVTRAGCRKLIKNLRPCGLALDEQFVLMAKQRWLTHRTVGGGTTHDTTPEPGVWRLTGNESSQEILDRIATVIRSNTTMKSLHGNHTTTKGLHKHNNNTNNHSRKKGGGLFKHKKIGSLAAPSGLGGQSWAPGTT